MRKKSTLINVAISSEVHALAKREADRRKMRIGECVDQMIREAINISAAEYIYGIFAPDGSTLCLVRAADDCVVDALATTISRSMHGGSYDYARLTPIELEDWHDMPIHSARDMLIDYKIGLR